MQELKTQQLSEFTILNLSEFKLMLNFACSANQSMDISISKIT